MSKWVIWVTSGKLSSLATFFVYEVSGEVMVKFRQKSILYRKVWSIRNAVSTTGRVSNYCNSQIANRLDPFNGQLESWESCLPKRYLRLQEEIEDKFRRCSAQKQNTAATSIVKIPYLLIRLADRVRWVMVRKLVELPNFLMFNSGTNSFENSSLFTLYLLLFAFIQISVFAFWAFVWLSDIFMSTFQMELNGYPHFNLAEDGRLCSMGQHCSGFPRVLYDTLIRLGYDRDAPVYHCRLSMAHGMDQWEVSVMIPFDPT
jgi:hypothetical protein